MRKVAKHMRKAKLRHFYPEIRYFVIMNVYDAKVSNRWDSHLKVTVGSLTLPVRYDLLSSIGQSLTK